jgi:hypothetical protein
MRGVESFGHRNVEIQDIESVGLYNVEMRDVELVVLGERAEMRGVEMRDVESNGGHPPPTKTIWKCTPYCVLCCQTTIKVVECSTRC